MVKRQKEKQYQSAVEHRMNSALRSGSSSRYGSSSSVRPLPFNCCALTLTPFESPVMRVIAPPDDIHVQQQQHLGILFENSAIMPYVMKHKADPVTGKPMSSRDLITLQMDKDEETESSLSGGQCQWQCPILNKPFLNHTKIVAVLDRDNNSANVYSYEAVHELNIKPKNYTDLISGKKFNKRRDIIIIQDPGNSELTVLRDINHFKHAASYKNGNHATTMGKDHNVKLSVTASRIMDKVKRKRQEDEKAEEASKNKKDKDGNGSKSESGKKLKIFSDDVTGVSLTSGRASGSLTSTVMTVTNDNDAREATDEEILVAQCAALKKLKKKGFVRLTIGIGGSKDDNHNNNNNNDDDNSFDGGEIDLELHCDIVPRTCMNFIGLVEKGAYNGTTFHRSIRNFMIQGGKPTRDKTASTTRTMKKKKIQETSLWGKAFVDEFDDRLKHAGGGILSMANAGANTNKMQFFITYKSAPHLDRKHSVFGRVVKGIDVLRTMEDIPTDKKDRPHQEITIQSAEVLYSPVKEATEKERMRIEKRAEAKRLEKEERRSSAIGMGGTVAKKSISGTSANVQSAKDQAPVVGKYLAAKITTPSTFSSSSGNSGNGGGSSSSSSSSSSGGSKSKSKNTEEETIVPVSLSRLPPPPKKTTFGDFSGW